MANLPIQNLNELLTSVNENDVFIIDDGEETKKIRASLLAVQLVRLFATNGGAGLHNSLFRGKNLGTSVTDEQKAQIAAGTFNDMWIGDYWVINNVTWRIAHFDYWYQTGDTICTTHHILVVPDTVLDKAQMNTTNVTTGAYIGSAMYTTNLATAKATVTSAFGNYVLKVRRLFQNAVTNGKPSAGTWNDSTVDLMTEGMIYGQNVFSPANDGSTIPYNYTTDFQQLALFKLAKEFINSPHAWYWLANVVSAAGFASVNGNGGAGCHNASDSGGVRPVVAICGVEQSAA